MIKNNNCWEKGILRLMPKPSLLTALIFCSIGFSNMTFAGAWVGKEGDGYGKIGYSVYEAKDFFGEVANFGSFTGENISYYAERGVGNNFAIFGTLLHQNLEQSDASNVSRKANGFGDTEVGTKYQWRAEPFVLSTSFLVKLPFLYHASESFPLGNGTEDFEVKMLIGKGLNAYGYFGLELGYRLITGAAADQYRYLLEYGFSVNKHLYFRTKLDGILSTKKVESTTATDANGANLSAGTGYDLGKLEVSAGWSFDKDENDRQWGVELSITPDIYGANTLKGNTVQFGITRVY